MTETILDLAERLAARYRLDIWCALEIACLMYELGIIEKG